MLSPEEKAQRARNRLINNAKKHSKQSVISDVSTIFQAMVRAEAAAHPTGFTTVVKDGRLTEVLRSQGQCACVTCGKVCPWSSSEKKKQMHAGHFIASRRNSILFDEANIAPQCAGCNNFGSGEQAAYTLWMNAVRGEDTVERLHRRKNDIVQFSVDELIDMKIAFSKRLKAAKERIG